jgi:hypothetical protein
MNIVSCERSEKSHTEKEMKSWDSSVGIVTRLRAGRSGVRIPTGIRDFSVFVNIQTRPGSHPVDIVVIAWRKAAVREVKHSNPSGTKAQNEWSFTSTPLIRLHGVDRDKVSCK